MTHDITPRQRATLCRVATRRPATVLALVLACCVGAAGCQSWDAARDGFINPFNRFLHRDYAATLAQGAAADLSTVYDRELLVDAAFRARLDSVLGRFERIERSHSVIDGIELLDGESFVRAEVSVSVHGVTAAGTRESVFWTESTYCRPTDGGWRIVDVEAEEASVVGAGGPVFSEEARARGIEFVHSSGRVLDRWARMQDYTPGAGLAVGDADGDGWEDVVFVNGKRCTLYRNVAGERFEDISEVAGLTPHGLGEGRCAAFGDYDGDGDQDLFVGLLGAADRLYRNDGSGRFTDVASTALPRPSGETTGAAFADFNGDSVLDLYIINGANMLFADPEPIYNALNAHPNQLLLGNGDGTFRDVTAAAGVGHGGWALTCSAVDYDLDGDVDIFVGNDFGFDVLYRNRGDATFEDATAEAGLTRRGASMSADWGDLDGDGRPDLFVAGMSSNSRWILDHPAFPAPAPWYINLVMRDRVLEIFSEMLHGNFLYLSAPAGTPSSYVELSSDRNVRNNGWAWSSILFDYDNDGLLDVYGTNGFISGPQPDDL